MQEGLNNTHSPPLFEKETLWVIGCLSLLVFMIYSNSLTNAFLFDDLNIVAENVFIRNWRFLPQIFSQGLLSGAGAPTDFYRPFQTFTYLLDYQIWGLNPIGYHLTNTALHILNVILFYALVVKMTGKTIPAAIASVLFAVHPVHTQAVTYISGRADLLAVAFCLLGLWSHIKSQEAQQPLFYRIGTALCFGLALLSKELALIFPCLILAYDVCLNRVRSAGKPTGLAKRYGLLLLTVLAYTSLRLSIPHLHSPHRISQELTILERLWTALGSLWTYARLIIAPVHLHVLYRTEPLHTLIHPRVIGGALLILGGLWLFIRSIKRAPVHAFFIAVVLIGFLPTFNIRPLNAFIAEHWLYVPLMGFSALAAVTVTQLFQRASRITTGAVSLGLIGVVAVGGVLTWKQNQVWRDPITFFTYSIRYVPDRPILYVSLGDNLRKNGQEAEALQAYQKAIELNPTYSPAFAGIGEHFLRQDDYLTAKGWYERALHTIGGGDNPLLLNDLGVVYLKLGQLDNAVKQFEQAVSLHPYRAVFWSNLGRAQALLGRHDQAVRTFQQALTLDPNQAGPHKNLGMLYFLRGQYQEAVVHFQQAVSREPDPQSYLNLGMAYLKLHNATLARTAWEKALALNPQYEDAKVNLQLLDSHRNAFNKASQPKS